jgi:short-subunit dehydrogenase
MRLKTRKGSKMPTALIIGASRGIGHELALQYKAAGWRVIATARKAVDLTTLQAQGCEVFLWMSRTSMIAVVLAGGSMMKKSMSLF